MNPASRFASAGVFSSAGKFFDLAIFINFIFYLYLLDLIKYLAFKKLPAVL